jgi:hypothetical protein
VSRYFPLKGHDPRSARSPKAYKTVRNDEKYHRRTSRAAITVVRMVINLQQYVRHGPCIPVRGDDRLLPLSELPYVNMTGRRMVKAEACANADHVSSAREY